MFIVGVLKTTHVFFVGISRFHRSINVLRRLESHGDLISAPEDAMVSSYGQNTT